MVYFDECMTCLMNHDASTNTAKQPMFNTKRVYQIVHVCWLTHFLNRVAEFVISANICLDLTIFNDSNVSSYFFAGNCTTFTLRLATKARSYSLGPLHPSFRIAKILRDSLWEVLPDNAHEIATGKLHISLTRVSDRQNVVVSEYNTKEELIQVWHFFAAKVAIYWCYRHLRENWVPQARY